MRPDVVTLETAILTLPQSHLQMENTGLALVQRLPVTIRNASPLPLRTFCCLKLQDVSSGQILFYRIAVLLNIEVRQ